MSEIRGAIKSHIKICVQVFLHTHGKNNKNELQHANPMAEKASTNAFFFWRWITGDGKDASLSRRIFAKKHKNKWNKMRWRRKHIKRKNALDSNIVQKFWPCSISKRWGVKQSDTRHGVAPAIESSPDVSHAIELLLTRHGLLRMIWKHRNRKIRNRQDCKRK